jgi:cytochrome c-type biogenesis protein CcmH/NrfG
MIAWLAVALLAAGVAAFVLAPLFRPGAAEAERTARVLSEEQDLESQREMALSALRDLEDDRSTGKIGDHDYEDLKTRLSARAVDILKRLDALRPPPA